MKRGFKVYTIGHSTRPLEEFIVLLRSHGVRQLADVRSIPRSRHNPQYEKGTLAKSLRSRRVNYRHLKALGGRRRARRDSELNAGWRSAAFRGYADYMQTQEFAAGLDALLELARKRPTAVMCAEAVPWRCHRSMIADSLTGRGVPVFHIMGAGRARPHALNPMARRSRGGRLTYPPTKPLPRGHGPRRRSPRIMSA